MNTAAVQWLEDRYKAVSAALDAVDRKETLTRTQYDLLREAGAHQSPMPPRPSVLQWESGGRSWRWRPLDHPGPDDWRPCP